MIRNRYLKYQVDPLRNKEETVKKKIFLKENSKFKGR
jgi:hypothetical protein